MVGHAGGLDEIILVAGAVVLFVMYRSGRARRGRTEPIEGPCLYCGHPLPAGVERCPECGFRARRRPTSSASGEGR
jgi:hypothetical protein